QGRAAQQRLRADVRTAAGELSDQLPRGRAPAEPRGAAALVEACAAAAGSTEVTRAVASSYRRRAGAHVGWPPLRWLGRLRPDPLRRLHLDRPSAAASSLPGPTRAQEAAVRTGMDDLAAASTLDMAESWRQRVSERNEQRTGPLVDALDSTVAATELGAQRRPAWWRVWSVLGLLLLATALVGGLWLAGLAVLSYLQLPEPGTPALGPLPWPTAALLGGLLAGALLAVLGRLLARVGARRAARGAPRRLAAGIHGTVQDVVLAPLSEDLRRYREFCAALELAAR